MLKFCAFRQDYPFTRNSASTDTYARMSYVHNAICYAFHVIEKKRGMQLKSAEPDHRLTKEDKNKGK